MNAARHQYQAYRSAMQTMAGTRQVVLLYDGVLRYLTQARAAMRDRRIVDRYNNLVRAAEIIFGLQSCLNFESGADVAKALYNFYASVDMRIFALHRGSDTQSCDLLIEDIRRMRDVWVEIDSAADQPQEAAEAPQDSGTADGVTLSA